MEVLLSDYHVLIVIKKNRIGGYRVIHENNDDVGVLGLAPCHHREKSQVRQTDQVWYHHQLQVSSLAVDLQWCYCPLHYLRREKRGRKKKKKEVLRLPRCYTHTHTHTRQSRGNPERQEEEKSGHTTGRRPKTAQGGEGNRRTSGTNLHGETDLTKTEHTPKPNDALRRSQQEGY